METEELPYHIPNKFKVGDQVLVVRDVEAAKAWYYKHDDYHKQAVGTKMFVAQVDPLAGYCLRAKRNTPLVTYFPSCSLELVPVVTEATVDVPSTQVAVEPRPARAPKPRTTSSQKPWDTAPCTHLRWHLMGLMKEKLKMTVSMVLQADKTPLLPRGYDGKPGGTVTVTTCCVKCGTKMNMDVPVEVR